MGLRFSSSPWIKVQLEKTPGEHRKICFFVIALIGPFGAFAAMQVLRHKTRKLKFYWVYVFILLHMAIAFWFLMRNEMNE